MKVVVVVGALVVVCSDNKSHSAAPLRNTSHPKWIICDYRLGKSTSSVKKYTTSPTLNTCPSCGVVHPGSIDSVHDKERFLLLVQLLVTF